MVRSTGARSAPSRCGVLFSRPLAWAALLLLSISALSAVWPRQSTLFAMFGIILTFGISVDQARRSAKKVS